MVARLYHRIDWWIEYLKWPVAIVAVLWTPLLIWAWLLLSYRVIEQPFASIWFASGVILFFVAWKSILRYRSVWRWLMRSEHEATHLLFAALTGHPIISWQPKTTSEHRDSVPPANVTSKRKPKAGSKNFENQPVQFLGEGNWLIQIAPYFFPTAAGILWFAAIFIPLGFLGWTTIALGLATGFHVTSTVLELRSDRDELQQLGWRFCWMFLPAANLLLLGCLLSFSQEGFSGIIRFIGDSWDPIYQVISYLRPQTGQSSSQ
jgi:hypothetical protein